MSAAVVMAAAAAALGTSGVVDLLAARRARRARRAPREMPARRGADERQRAGVRRHAGPRLLAVVVRLAPRTGGRVAGRDLQARLEAAGVALGGGDFALLRGGLAVAGLLAVLPLAWAVPGRAGLMLLIAGPAAGHLAPAAWLARRMRRRAATVERELADVLDLLRVAVGAGLSPLRAVGEVGRRHPGVLATELRRVAARRSLGLPVAQVLDELERRTPGEGVPALAAALRRADRHGAPLAGALTAQAREARSRAAARTTEAAARAAPRIQLVVALLLVPSVLALVAAALLPAVMAR
jgi:tight adherence protein C